MWPFTGKGVSGFSWKSTAEEVTNGIDATGLTAIVTGISYFITTLSYPFFFSFSLFKQALLFNSSFYCFYVAKLLGINTL